MVIIQLYKAEKQLDTRGKLLRSPLELQNIYLPSYK